MNDIILTTEGCRYCLMCRHICPVTRVTYSEATSPHGWALAIASVRRGLLDWNAETADLLYQCADCGLCRSFCVTDQPLPDAIVAARAEVTAAGHAPAAVAVVDAALRRWGNPYGAHRETAEGAEPAEVALFVGAAAWHRERASVDAARQLLVAAGVAHGMAGAGRASGYLAYTLGLHETARELARATLAELERIGCRTLVALSPEQAHTFGHVYPLLGAPLPASVEVIELTALLANMLDDGRLRLRAAPLDLAYHDPCQTPRLEGRWRAPRRLLAAITSQPPREGFWRERRAAPCGASGGLSWTEPWLATRMARAALADAANGGAPLIVTDAPGCLAQLRANAEPGMEVRGLYELLAERIEN
ncbi:MAG: (Fe-S)-binding protein [Roseiflexaceae bacterium]